MTLEKTRCPVKIFKTLLFKSNNTEVCFAYYFNVRLTEIVIFVSPKNKHIV